MSSVLPSSNSFQKLFSFFNLYTVNIKQGDIFKIIRNLDVNKAHSHDISIRMWKICHLVVMESLSITLRNFVELEHFQIIITYYHI